MARVPTTRAGNLQLQPLSNVRVQAADNNGGVGGAIGRGLQDMGQGVREYAQTAAAIDEERARTSADDVLLGTQGQAREIKLGYLSKQGKDALDARGDADAALGKLFDDAIAGVDKRTAKYLRPRLEAYRGMFADQIAGHATQQLGIWQEATGAARLQNFGEQAEENRADPDLRVAFLADGKAQLRENLARKGLADPDIVKSEELKWVSGVHASIANRMLADGDVDGANAYFKANLGELTAKDEIGLAAALKSPLEKRDTAAKVARVMGGGWSDDTGTSTNYADPLRGAGKGVSSGYGVARGNGKTHNGVDFPAAAGTPIYAIGAGKVARAGFDDRSGNFVVIDHGDGTTSSYSHMKVPTGLKVGDTVTPDTLLGGVGTTGHSTGPHLHLVVKKDGSTVDPQKVIGSAQQSPKRHDLDTLLKRIDNLADQEKWTFESREMVKEEARRRVSTDETLQARLEDDADRAANELVIARGSGFTDISQLPANVRNNLHPTAVQRYMGIAKANAKPAEVKANSIDAMRLHAIQYGDPDQFIRTNLSEFMGKVTPAELDSAVSDQARLRGPGGDKILQTRSGINSAIATQVTFDPAMRKLLDPKTNPENYARVARDMEAFITSMTGGKREPTGQEMDAAWKRAIMPVAVPNTSLFGRGDETQPRFQAGGRYQVAVPVVVRERIIASWRKAHNGQMPPDGVIGDLYVQNKGKPGFWE